ncbi:MAG TPA: FtsX-like permease family protein, partial [Puia sp.]|nr:FtsX-like permease family protein [Puia sp.]
MLFNYWRIAWRFLIRNKLYTGIHIVGLALGICGCVVLFLTTSYEFSFDRKWADGGRIYRIVGEIHRPDGLEMFANSPFEDVAGFETQIPGFDAKAAIFPYDGKISVPQPEGPSKNFDNHIGDQYQSAAAMTVAGYFSVFQYRWLAGNAAVLDRQNELVLTESRGRLYFGNISPAEMIGKTVLYDDSLQVHVGGVVQDHLENTDVGYTDFISIATATHSFLKDWIPTADWKSLRPHQSMAWVRLAKGVTAGQVNARFAEYIRRRVALRRGSLNFYLQPLEDIHFTRNFHRGDDGDMWRKPYLPELYAMIGVAIFILLIAAINFVNLSTAQSMSRAKEVGVRKVMGSRLAHIRIQFLIETLLVVLLAVLLAVSLVNPVLHAFRDYLPKGVHFEPTYPGTLAFLAGITLLTTFLAGSYPAWVMARHQPVESLKGEVTGAVSGTLALRRALIVFQFAVSLVFIIGAIVVARQIRYMRLADKGFSTDRILTVTSWSSKPDQLREYANSIR